MNNQNFFRKEIGKEVFAVKKRYICALLSVIVTAVFLGGCGTGQVAEPEIENGTAEQTTQSTNSSGVVELKVWSDETQFPMLEKMVAGFQEKYKDQATFAVTYENVSESSTRDAILGDIYNTADIFAFADDQLNSLAAGGVLDPVLNVEEVKNANLPAAVEAATINDKLFAYPMTADNGYFLYYDKDYFSPEDVMTLDSILAICEENEKKFSMEISSGWYLYAFYGNTGLEMRLSEDGISNICNWDAKDTAITGLDVAEALNLIVNNPTVKVQGDDGFLEGAKEGSVIAGVSGTWHAKQIEELWGSEYGACKLPTYTCAGKQIQMASFKGYKMMGVNYYSKNKEWAHKLAEWLTNEENQILRFEEMNVGPSNINAAASDAVSRVPAIAAIIAQSEYGVVQRVGNNYWAPCEDMIHTLQTEELHGDDLQKLLDSTVNRIISP